MTDAGRRRVAWVTGAGKGIGRELARRLASEGWIVAVSARSADDLHSLVATCAPGAVEAFPLDVTDLAATEATVAAIEDSIGPLDLAVLNAGTHIPVSAEDFSVDAFRRLVDTNLMGTVNGLAQILPRFIGRRRGQIAVVASVAGYAGLPTAAAYGASKAGLIAMCESLKPELDRHGVRLTLVNPGFVKTPLTDRNEFPMPFLIPVEEAAERIMRGLAGSGFEVAFPRRLALPLKLLRMLPYRLFFAVTRRMLPR